MRFIEKTVNGSVNGLNTYKPKSIFLLSLDHSYYFCGLFEL